jgi:hypothetical protein
MMVKERILEIEKRFKEVSGIDADLSIYPLSKQSNLQVTTRQTQSKNHGEVFTPLWLVDKMIESVDDDKFKEVSTTLDLCAGYGQYSVRLLRKYYSIQGEDFDLDLFLEKHWVSELQKSSAYKLLYVFGKELNIAMGDSLFLDKLPEDARGVYYYSKTKKSWISNRAKSRHYTLEMFKSRFVKFDKQENSNVK